jgi:citrate lyase subunit beta/citryl-CoA lyase
VALDLEDGTPPQEKDPARHGIAEAVRLLAAQAPGVRVLVRINRTADLMAADVDAVAGLPITAIVVPKLGAVEEMSELDEILGSRETAVVAGLETAAGVEASTHLLRSSSRICGAYFGAEDFASDLGAERTPEGFEVLYARSRVALAARLAGIPALDQIVLEPRDDGRFLEDAIRGRQLGYAGKMCIHPSQVPLANRVFSSTVEALERSRRLVDAYEAAVRAGRAVIEFEGQMVDGPLVRRARAALETARHREEPAASS